MRKKRFTGIGRKEFGYWIEVLLPVIIMTFALICSPAGVLAAEDTNMTVNAAVDMAADVSAKDTNMTAGIAADVAVDAESTNVTGYVFAEETNTPANVSVDEAVEEANNTLYRIQPLRDKLAQMDQTSAQEYAGRFSDMEKHWSMQQVGKLAQLDIIAGVNGKFLPEDPVQADQFIKMAVMAMGYKLEGGAGYWAQPYIDAAVSEGIVAEGEFADYRKPLSREQMSRIIVRTALKLDAKPDEKYNQFIVGGIVDYSDIEDSLKQYVIDAYSFGLITGVNNKFNPKDTLTRAEAAAVIVRFLDVLERKPKRPGEDEVIRLDDSRGNPVEIYPGSIPELFTIAKAAQEAIPKAKGYVCYFIGSDGKFVCAKLYKDKDAFDQSIYNMIAAFNIAFNDRESTYAYTMTVWNDEAYKEYFPDYIREILKAVFEKDAAKAIAFHDKYMNMRYTRTDGYNDYTEANLNNRYTVFVRFDDSQFGIKIKLKGLK